MDIITINVKAPYRVYIDKKILEKTPLYIKEAVKESYHDGLPAFIVTDKNVSAFYMKSMAKALKKNGFTVYHAVFRPGERLKTHRSLERLLHLLVKHGMTRDSVIIGLGGGVIGDFAGFAASIYMRGCRFVQVPTSLLAQVDSSVGGKVGINLREGKNLVGNFFHPLLVLADIDALKTLPDREFTCGLAEIIKHGLIFNKKLFERIDAFFLRYSIDEKPFSHSAVKTVLLKDPDFLQSIITKSIKIKGDIVSSDERENDLRMILNFGHTFGHAIETLTGYKRFLHGEAVLLGMKIASELSRESNRISPQENFSIQRLLNRFVIPSVRGLSSRAVYSQISRDKKLRGGKIHYILLKECGYAVWETDIEKERVIACIEKVLSEHRKPSSPRQEDKNPD
jgi:3-dehydroquinate synthase